MDREASGAGRFRRLVEGSRDLVVLLDREGRIVYANAAVGTIFGLDPARIVGAPLVKWVARADVEATLRVLPAIVESRGEHFRYEHAVRAADGSERWLDVEIANLLEDPEVAAICIVARDVTDRRRAERVRQASEAQIRAVFETAAQGVAIVQDGRVVFANRSVADMVGIPFERFFDTSAEEWFSLVHPEDRKTAAELYRVALEGEAVRTRGVYRHRLADGTTRWVDVSVQRGLHDGKLALFVIANDITEMRRAQEALKSERDFVSAVLDTVAALIVVLDRGGRIVGWNAACERVTGYSESEALGRRLDELVVNEVEREAVESLVSSIESGEFPREFVHAWTPRHGEARLIEWRNSMMRGEDGRVRFVIGTGIDITERIAAENELRGLEAQLRQAQKMEAIGQLTGGIAHDFNNILTAMLGAAELVRSNVTGHADDVLADLDEIVRAGRRGAQLVAKLMAFSRHDPLALEPLDLASVGRDLRHMWLRLLPENVIVHVRLDGDDFRVRADRSAIEQILVNLATNARDAMPNGGRLVVTLSRTDRPPLEASGSADVSWVVVNVTDTGIGMDELTRSRLFEPFFTTKPMGRGTGLGLSMVYGLVKKHGGFIEVDSAVGEGTSFRLYFPHYDGPMTESVRPAREAKRGGGGEHVLVVEDDGTIRRSVKRILERNGYTVALAADGQEALDRFDAGEHYDLVITDVVMPRMSGPALFDALRGRGVATPFLFTSGYPAGEMDRMEPLRPELPILRKPWEVEELVRAVRDALDGS